MKNQSCFYAGVVLIAINLPVSMLHVLRGSVIGVICCSVGVLCGLVMMTLSDPGRLT
jgi:phosphate/sulfate permease